MRAVTIGQNEAGQRLDKFLNKYMKEAGVSFFYKMMRKKNIVLNGKKCTGKEILLIGDEVKLFLAEETLEKFGAPPADYSAQKKAAGAETKEYLLAFEKLKNIRILYEDEDILALDKPAGVLSQKASVTDFSANEWLIGYLLSQKKLTAEALATFHPSVCNRLDRNTSGLLLCGKSLLGTQKLTGLIRNRQIHKYYRLFLLGEVKEKQILNGYLLKDTKKNQVKILTKPAEGADEIKTGIEPLVCLELPGIGTVTYAQAELFTGKTHQIRAHFAWAGHPLLGDPKYGNEAVNRTLKQTYGIGRQLLHAWQIRQKDAASGILPTGGITCPLPEDFQKLLLAAGIQP